MSSPNAIPTVTPKKLSERRQRRAAEILAAAEACFLEKGFDRTAVSEVAQKAGIAEGLVFNYFPTKRDLLHAVLGNLYQPLIRDVEEGYHRLRGLKVRLRFLIWRHLRVYLETPRMAKLVLHEVRSGPFYMASGLHDLNVRYTQPLVDTLRDAVAEGEIGPEVQVDMLRAAVFGTIEHLMWPVLFGRGSISLEETADQITQLLLGGMTMTSKRDGGLTIEGRLERIESVLEKVYAAQLS